MMVDGKPALNSRLCPAQQLRLPLKLVGEVAEVRVLQLVASVVVFVHGSVAS